MLPNGTSLGAEAELDAREQQAREAETAAISRIKSDIQTDDAALADFLAWVVDAVDVEAADARWVIRLLMMHRNDSDVGRIWDAVATYAAHMARREAGA